MDPIPLDTIAAGEVDAFLQYLRVQLNAAGHWVEASTRGAKDREIWRVLWAPADPEYTNCEITLELVRRADGTLEPLNARASGDVPAKWTQQVRKVVDNAVAATKSKAQDRFAFRFAFAYIGPPIQGEYYVSDFRLAPAVPEDPNVFPEERVVFLDLEEDGADIADAHARAKVKADKIAALLSVFADVGITRQHKELRWVILADDKCEKRWVTFAERPPKIARIPTKGEECQAGPLCPADRGRRDSIKTLFLSYMAPRDESLLLPDDVATLFRAFDGLCPKRRDTYMGAASLYRIADTAGRYYPSVEMAYRAAAVESLAANAAGKREGFADLVETFCPEASPGDAKWIYDRVRSSHFHAGRLPGGEYEPLGIGPFVALRSMSYQGLRWYVHAVTHSVLIRWLLSEAGAWP